jgi:predicted O-methyltransferase YrrM
MLTLARSYKPACILAAAADLDLFSIFTDKPLTASEITAALGADLRGTTILLDALASLEVVSKRAGRYTTGAAVRRLLTPTGQGSILAMVQHQANCLRRWTQIAKVVKTGKPAEREPSIRGEEGDHESFIEAMDNIAAPTATAFLSYLGPPQFRHLLDIGGASGTWTVAFLSACPDGAATLFDLPPVIPLAKRRIGAAGLEDRVAFVGGDFMVDPLPKGADLAWLSAIAHQNSREQNRRLFASIHEALADGGQLFIRDVLMDDSRIAPIEGALFAINMLVGTDGGGTFTFDELREDLETAGLASVSVIRRDPAMNSIVRAVKPSAR